MRLDHYLVATGQYESRHKAQIEIKAGAITVNNHVVFKPAYQLKSEDDVQIIKTFNPFVSKGGLKLTHALESFHFDVKGRTICDVGASTGGFTDVLLKAGAHHVYAIDVGINQLVEKIKNHPQVTSFEGLNFLNTHSTDFKPIDLIVMDVSFTSSIPLIHHAKTQFNSPIIVLVKPQFESLDTPKSGVIKDKKMHLTVLRNYESKLATFHIPVETWCYSNITGGSGNIEFFAYIDTKTHTQDLRTLIEEAHQNLR